MAQNKIKVTFICLGNICRSPMADGVFQHLVDEAGLTDRFEVDSCGTGGWHVGERPHVGTRGILQKYGIAYNGRARQLSMVDGEDESTWLIAMDGQNRADVIRRIGEHPRLYQLLEFADRYPDVHDVPDPYYTGNFEYVYQLVENGCAGLLAEIRAAEQL